MQGRSERKMKIERALNKLLYSVSLRTAIASKNHYYRRTMEMHNRSIVETFAGDWDKKSRIEEYRAKVLPYWKRFGRRPDMYWFELAGSREQKMDPRYIPSDLYYIELLPYMNNMQFRFALEDKNYLDMRFSDVKQAPAVCRRIAGEYYDEKMKLIQPEDAVKLCMEREGELFIKPALYTGFGRGIQSFVPAEYRADHGDERAGEMIRELFRETGANCIVQEKIRQHKVLSELSPDSVCTIRVLSLFIEGKVYVPNVYLRVSIPGSSHVVVGSEYNAQILPDGSISHKICLDEGGWFDNHKEGIFPESTVIPGLDRVIEQAKKLHPRGSHLKWIGWDFTLDEDGDPLLIEFNTSPGDNAHRVCACPLFGRMTDWLLEDYFWHRSMEDNQLRGVWITNYDISKYRE